MARSPRPADERPAPVWSRRALLRTGTGLAVLGGATLAGCSPSDPTPDGPTPGSGAGRGSAGPTASAAPAPAPPGSPTQAAQEQGLAELARAVRRRSGLSRDQRRLLDAMVTAHTDHARVLAGADPTSRPATGTAVRVAAPSLSGQSTEQALHRLATAEASLAGRHRRAAVAASGLTALLWGSLAVAAEGYAGVDDDRPPAASGLRAHRPMAVLSDVAATQQVVAQLDAVVWGYQLAIGKIPVASHVRPRALAGLAQHRVLRDRLTLTLTARKAEVPAAAAAYTPSTNPTDAGSAAKLIRSMETALLPFCGLWLAAAGSTADRELALTTLRTTARTARTWGAGVRAWPGWSD